MLILKKEKHKNRMSFKDLIKNLKSHYRTITDHKKMVFRHCVKAGIPLQGLLHDLSKYTPTEFVNGVLFYQGTCSPSVGERKDHGCSYAWMHHKGRNKHHFEYWTDYDPVTSKMSGVKMPLKYVKEMFCDRVAASKIYNGENYKDSDSLEYFLKAKNTRMIHPETSRLLEHLLRMLAQKGEDYTFKYIRRLRHY